MKSFPDTLLDGYRRFRAGRLALRGAWFDIATGQPWVLDDAAGTWARAAGGAYQA